MTDAELDILREAAIGPVRGLRAGDHVTVEHVHAVRSTNGGGWQHVDVSEATGWVDNLDESGGTVMLYDREVVTAVRFSEVVAVRWRQGRVMA